MDGGQQKSCGRLNLLWHLVQLGATNLGGIPTDVHSTLEVDAVAPVLLELQGINHIPQLRFGQERRIRPIQSAEALRHHGATVVLPLCLGSPRC